MGITVATHGLEFGSSISVSIRVSAFSCSQDVVRISPSISRCESVRNNRADSATN